MWKLRLVVVLFGFNCGLAYHTYKIEEGADSLWNIRLPLVLILGTLLFYLVNYLSTRALGLVSGRYDRQVQVEDLKTYLPLCLFLLYPLEKPFITNIWPKSLFLYLGGVYLVCVVVLKGLLFVNIRRGAIEKTEDSPAEFLGHPFACAAAIVLGIPVFWFHQFTFAFDNFVNFIPHKNPPAHYWRHNDVTRKTLSYGGKIKLSLSVPYEDSIATVGYKLLKGISGEVEGAVPIRFELSVTDARGNAIAQRRALLNAVGGNGDWENFEVELTPHKSETVQFTMKSTPLVFNMGWRYLLKFLLHSPVDFEYYEGLSVRPAWTEPEISVLRKNRSNAILIVLDTLRPDKLGCYGHKRDISSSIDSFARENIKFENAFSQATWTLPSHLSLLTGQFPNELGTTYFRSQHSELPERNLKRISSLTLPEIFKRNGYYCAAFTDGVFVSSFYGFYKGFHLYDERYGAGGNSFSLARQWIASNKDKNFFLFIHTFMIHDYVHGTMPTPRGASERETQELIRTFRAVFPDAEDFNDLTLSEWYDVRIRLVDSHLGKLFSFLKGEGLYDDTIIVLTSDHGESIFGEVHNNGETRLRSHGHAPYESQIRVPLILKLPASSSVEPQVIYDDVRLLDIAPTFLSALNFKVDPQFRGRPLISDLASAAEAAYPFVYATWSKPGGGIREDEKKYIFHEGAGTEEFYHLVDDPEERRNLAARQPEEMLVLREKFSKFRSEVGRGGVTIKESIAHATEDLREKLKALGYIE